MPLAATVYSNLYHKRTGSHFLVTQFLISKVAERCLAGMTFCWKTNPEENKHLCVCLRKRQFVLWFILFENRPTLLLQSIHIFLSMFGCIPASSLCWQQSKQSRCAKDVGQLHSVETSVAVLQTSVFPAAWSGSAQRVSYQLNAYCIIPLKRLAGGILIRFLGHLNRFLSIAGVAALFWAPPGTPRHRMDGQILPLCNCNIASIVLSVCKAHEQGLDLRWRPRLDQYDSKELPVPSFFHTLHKSLT